MPKRRFFKPDDGYYDLLVKFIPVAGVALAAYVYFHNIYPVFDKSRELEETKAALAETRTEKETILSDMKKLRSEQTTLESAIRSREESAEELKSAIEHLESERASLSRSLEQERAVAKAARISAVQAHLTRLVDVVLSEGLEAYRQSTVGQKPNHFDLKECCLRIATEGLKKSDIEVSEREAYRTLREFATTRLRSGISDEYTKICYLPLFYSSPDIRIKTLDAAD